MAPTPGSSDRNNARGRRTVQAFFRSSAFGGIEVGQPLPQALQRASYGDSCRLFGGAPERFRDFPIREPELQPHHDALTLLLGEGREGGLVSVEGLPADGFFEGRVS